MGSLKTLALAGAIAAASSGSALAADLFAPAPAPAPMVQDFGGWYLRGDVGVGALDFRGTRAIDASTPSQPYVYDRLQDHVGDQAFVGVGVGYQFNGWLRADVTGEYRTSTDWRFNAEDRTFGVPGGYNVTTGKFSSVVGLANLYFDLGTWGGVTPFIGAGVGFAHHMFGSVNDQGYGLYAGGFGYGGERDTTSLAYAVHAGLGYAVSPNLKLELAYRYLNMGDAETGTVGCLPSCAGNLQTVYRLKELESHDIKLAMRWMLGGPVSAPAAAEAPLIRKY